VALLSARDESVRQELITGRAPSLAHVFRDRVAASGPRTAYQYFRGTDLLGVTWDESKVVAYEWAAGLAALGVCGGDRVAVASGTRYEWVLADLAIMCAGAATTTIYPTTVADDVAYILADSGSRVVFAEDEAQVAKLRERRAAIPDVAAVVLLDGSGADDGWVIPVRELARLGRERLAAEPGLVDARIDALTPEHLATIIYTSGTTGRPKGVLLTHDCLVYEAAAVHAVSLLGQDDLQYLWLPLAHVFGKVLLALPMEIGFPTAIDGRIDKIVENLAVVRPTFMGAAPRIFEKAHARITMTVRQEGGVKERLFGWATGVGAQVAALRERGEQPRGPLAARFALADRLVLRKVRERFGGRMRFFISGSAALNPDVARWFGSVGLLVIEGYGLTESSAASVVNRPRPGGYVYGTVGWPLPGTEVKIADDGEILLRGPGVMRGYHHRDEETKAALDGAGFLHTGDIGALDDRGFLRVTDRKKDLFKTSGGKYVAPSAIESTFRGICPYVSQIMVYGEARSFASALITLDPEAVAAWAARTGAPRRSYAEAVGSEQARALVQGYVDQLNAGLNRWETIKRFAILERDLSVDEGELTPSMKLRRRVVTQRHQPLLDALYSSSTSGTNT